MDREMIRYRDWDRDKDCNGKWVSVQNMNGDGDKDKDTGIVLGLLNVLDEISLFCTLTAFMSGLLKNADAKYQIRFFSRLIKLMAISLQHESIFY